MAVVESTLGFPFFSIHIRTLDGFFPDSCFEHPAAPQTKKQRKKIFPTNKNTLFRIGHTP
jgi:hypothetical protein